MSFDRHQSRILLHRLECMTTPSSGLLWLNIDSLNTSRSLFRCTAHSRTNTTRTISSSRMFLDKSFLRKTSTHLGCLQNIRYTCSCTCPNKLRYPQVSYNNRRHSLGRQPHIHPTCRSCIRCLIHYSLQQQPSQA